MIHAATNNVEFFKTANRTSEYHFFPTHAYCTASFIHFLCSASAKKKRKESVKIERREYLKSCWVLEIEWIFRFWFYYCTIIGFSITTCRVTKKSTTTISLRSNPAKGGNTKEQWSRAVDARLGFGVRRVTLPRRHPTGYSALTQIRSPRLIISRARATDWKIFFFLSFFPRNSALSLKTYYAVHSAFPETYLSALLCRVFIKRALPHIFFPLRVSHRIKQFIASGGTAWVFFFFASLFTLILLKVFRVTQEVGMDLRVVFLKR